MILIKNGKVFTATGKNYDSGCVLIDDGKIIDVGENICAAQDMEVLDAKGGWIVPGIIDAHCHVGIFEEDMGSEGSDGNESVDPVTPQLRALDAINPMDAAFNEALEAGITTVMTGPGSANVIGGQFVAMKTYGTSIDEMVILEPAAVKVAFGENPKRVYSNQKKTPSTRMGTAAVLRETLTKAKNYKSKKEKAALKGEDIEIDFKMEAMLPVLDKKIPLKAHAHRADDILTALRIAKEFDVLITLDHCTDGHLIPEYIKASGAPALVGPTMTFRTKIETRNKSFSTPAVLNEHGVKVAIITDHPVTPIQYLPICAGLAAKQGLGIEEALKAITINAAEICGIADRVGSIEIGKDADISIFSGNPMEVFTETLYTLIDGRIAYKNAKLV